MVVGFCSPESFSLSLTDSNNEVIGRFQSSTRDEMMMRQFGHDDIRSARFADDGGTKMHLRPIPEYNHLAPPSVPLMDALY